jgi:hypothetical protein
LHVHVGHVIRLVVEHTGLLPGSLLISPVGKFAGNNRIYVWTCL